MRHTLFHKLANTCEDIGAHETLGLLLGIVPVALFRILIVLCLEGILVGMTWRD